MRLRTDNVFSGNFLPPKAALVPERMQALWRCLRQVEAAGASPVESALVAYAGFFVLLTLHPFADGNGRTARMFYAAALQARRAECPRLALALPLSFADGGRRFHQAALLARSGRFDELRANFLDAVDLAGRYFGGDLDRLVRALDGRDPAAVRKVFAAIHATVQGLTAAHEGTGVADPELQPRAR